MTTLTLDELTLHFEQDENYPASPALAEPPLLLLDGDGASYYDLDFDSQPFWLSDDENDNERADSCLSISEWTTNTAELVASQRNNNNNNSDRANDDSASLLAGDDYNWQEISVVWDRGDDDDDDTASFLSLQRCKIFRRHSSDQLTFYVSDDDEENGRDAGTKMAHSRLTTTTSSDTVLTHGTDTSSSSNKSTAKKDTLSRQGPRRRWTQIFGCLHHLSPKQTLHANKTRSTGKRTTAAQTDPR